MIKEFHESKNLFDGTYTKGFIGTTYIFKNTGTSANCAIISVSPDTTYTVTKYDESNRFAIGTSNVLPYDEIQLTGIYYVDTATTYTFTTDRFAHYMVVYVSTGTEQAEPRLMINVGSTALPYEPYGDTWNTKSYAKIVVTTQQVTSFPVVVRPMENTIPSWTINGNMVQDGTPTPSNPVDVNGVGVRTENLFDGSTSATNQRLSTSGTGTYAAQGYSVSRFIEIEPSTYYTITTGETSYYNLYNENKQYIYGSATNARIPDSYANARYIRFDFKTENIPSVMLVKGSTAPSAYEPYGYKIPISSGGVTTNIYLGSTQSTRQIKKLVLTGGEAFSKNDADSTHYLYYGGRGSLLPNSIEKTPLLCNELPVTSGAPQSQVGISSNNNFNVVYLNFGADVMNAQPSGNTPNGVKEYLAAQYAAGTPVCVWYVLATETTGIVNEPLRKIGTYSDSVSGTNLSVTAQSPTTIDVDTTLKPSEMDLTYTGLKMCGRKKYAHGNSPQILPSAKAGSRTSGNMTLTCDGNGVYTLVGSPTPNAVITFDIPPTEIPLSVGEGGNGTLSLFNDSVYNNFDITFIYQGTPYRNAVAYRPNTLNKTSTTYGSNSSGIGGKTIISIGVRLLDYGDINCTFSPMITNDGQLPSTFQPYCSWQ